MWNPQTQQVQVVAQHSAPIQTVDVIPDVSCVATGGWDSCFNMWDLRQAAGAKAASISLPGKVYAADVFRMMVVICLSNKKVHIYDCRNTAQPYRVHSPEGLSYQLRRVACFPDGIGFVIGGVEGKCEVAYVQAADQGTNFRFKCHRRQENAFPVNGVSFHPQTSALATVGGDGSCTLWDKTNKTRLNDIVKSGPPLTAVSFSTTGNILAYATGNDWCQGYSSSNPAVGSPSITLYSVQPQDVQPKPKHSGRR
jgi:mRNA export factor